MRVQTVRWDRATDWHPAVRKWSGGVWAVRGQGNEMKAKVQKLVIVAVSGPRTPFLACPRQLGRGRTGDAACYFALSGRDVVRSPRPEFSG